MEGVGKKSRINKLRVSFLFAAITATMAKQRITGMARLQFTGSE